MKDDTELKQMFDAFRPTLPDSEEFIQRLEQRIAAIEYINKMQRRESKHSRLILLSTFIGGLIVGCMSYAIFIAPDEGIPSLTVDTHFMLMRIVSENINLFACALLTSIGLAGIAFAIGTWYDFTSIRNIRDMMLRMEQPSR